MIVPTIHHIEQYAGEWIIMVVHDKDGFYAHTFHIKDLDPLLLEARGFPSMDNAIQTARYLIDKINE